MHSPWLVTVVQDPVQTVPALVLQYVTVTDAAESVCWKRGFRRAAKGSPIKGHLRGILRIHPRFHLGERDYAGVRVLQ